MTAYKTVLSVTAIFCISGLEGYAMYLGFNGTLFALALCIIAGIAGYKLKSFNAPKGDI